MRKIYLLLLVATMISPMVASAQCKNFVKKKCAPQLENYIPSDKFNSLRMVEGEEAEMELIFVANHDIKF